MNLSKSPPLINPEEFTDIKVKCIDGKVKTHKIALVYISKYFVTYFSTPMQTQKIPELQFSSKALEIILELRFYRILFGMKVLPKVSYLEVAEIYRCGEFLMIGGLEKFAEYLMVTLDGEYSKSAFEFLKLYPKLIPSRALSAMSNKKIIELTKISDIFDKINLLPNERCYALYKANINFPMNGYPYKTFMGKVSTLFTFADYEDVYNQMISKLTDGETSDYLLIRSVVVESRQYVIKKRGDITFNVEKFTKIDRVMEVTTIKK